MSDANLPDTMEMFGSALKRFEEVLEQERTEYIIDACVQRFEFTCELGRKALRQYLESEGAPARHPGDMLKSAFVMKLIDDQRLWISMIKDRNMTSHLYNQEIALEVVERMPGYLAGLQQLHAEIARRLAESG